MTLLRLLGLSVIGFIAAGPALGQSLAIPTYPTKPIRIVVPYAPGGSTDIVARIIGEQMRQSLGQPIVVESKIGANGIVAVEEMARSKDGYTLMVGNVTTNAITPVIDARKYKIDYGRDVVAVQRLVDVPHFILGTMTNFAPKTLPEVLEFARKNPGKVRYGTVGVGSYPHYDTALLASRAGNLDMIAIHNKAGAAGEINDLITGDMQIAIVNVASSTAMVKAGKIRALATINTVRLPEFPDAPTMTELGFPGVGTMAWQGLFASAATPKEILDVLFKASTSALEQPAAKELLAKQYYNIVPAKSLDDAKDWLGSEIALWRKTTSEIKIETAE